MTHPFHADSTHLRPTLNYGPLIVSVDMFVSNESLDVAAGSTIAQDVSVQSPARSLLVKVTDAGNTAIPTFTITGTNQFGEAISEDVTVTVSGGATTEETSNCFQTISSVVLTTKGGTIGAGDVVSVGPGNRVALQHKITSVDEVVAITQVPQAAAGETLSVAGSSTYVDLQYNCLKGLSITADDTLAVTLQLKAKNSDSRFAG